MGPYNPVYAAEWLEVVLLFGGFEQNLRLGDLNRDLCLGNLFGVHDFHHAILPWCV